jgi:hypothetical protein
MSIVRRIVEVNLCLENLFPFIMQKYFGSGNNAYAVVTLSHYYYHYYYYHTIIIFVIIIILHLLLALCCELPCSAVLVVNRTADLILCLI